MAPGYVYLARHGATNIFKIGYSKNVPRRMDTLSTGSPVPLHIERTWFLYNNASGFEALLHSMFWTQRSKDSRAKEFFKFDNIQTVIDEIEKVHAHQLFVDPTTVPAQTSKANVVLAVPAQVKITQEVGQLRAQRRVLSATIKAKEHAIKDWIGEHAGAETATGQPLAEHQTRTHNVFSLQEFQTAHPDLYAQFCRQRLVRKLHVY